MRRLGGGGGAGADGGRSRRRRGCLDTDAANRAGGCIDVPRTAVGDDHARTRRQRGGRGGGKQFGGTLDEALAAGVPSRLAALHQRIQHIGNGRRSDAGAGFGAFAQQVGDVAGRRRGFVVRGNGPWRGGGGDTAALADQQGGDEAGVRVIAGRQFEYDPLALFFGGGIGEGVEEGLLFGPPQCREAVECGERRRRQMFAACNAAGAAVVEHHAAAEQGGGDRDGVGEGLVLDGAGDGVAVQLDVYAAGESQGAASGEGAGTEDTAEVLRRERRRHGRGVTSRGKWVPSSVRPPGVNEDTTETAGECHLLCFHGSADRLQQTRAFHPPIAACFGTSAGLQRPAAGVHRLWEGRRLSNDTGTG